eukprot:4045986-Alexandrium_andersonii.AAC.2
MDSLRPLKSTCLWPTCSRQAGSKYASVAALSVKDRAPAARPASVACADACAEGKSKTGEEITRSAPWSHVSPFTCHRHCSKEEPASRLAACNNLAA